MNPLEKLEAARKALEAAALAYAIASREAIENAKLMHTNDKDPCLHFFGKR